MGSIGCELYILLIIVFYMDLNQLYKYLLYHVVWAACLCCCYDSWVFNMAPLCCFLEQFFMCK